MRKELEELRKRVQNCDCIFSFQTIADKNELVAHFTGLPNKQTFYAIRSLFENFDLIYKQGWKVTRLSKEDQLFLTLLKLRRGLSNQDLATKFKVSKATVANVFLTFLMALHHLIAKNLLHLPSRAKNQTSLPECFRDYKSTRVVLDCTEITTANPTLLSDQSKFWSSYKHRITCKALVGVVPNGTVAFVSDLYPGSFSDRAILIDTGILDLLVPGDCNGRQGFQHWGFNARRSYPQHPPFQGCAGIYSRTSRRDIWNRFSKDSRRKGEHPHQKLQNSGFHPSFYGPICF